MSLYTNLSCSHCGKQYNINEVHNYCTICIQPLLAGYDIIRDEDKSLIDIKRSDMWRYSALLPVRDAKNVVTLGEGGTPLLQLKKTSSIMDVQSVFIKEEGLNPTGSFKARGISMAVSKATELGIRSFCIPTAGNAGSALAAYAAATDAKAHIYMPEATPMVFQLDCEVMGAQVTKVKGSIRDAGLAMAKDNIDSQWWDITTLKEPFRLEGKKTMGYEIAEQLNWKLPDVIIYPTGGGTGLIGIWKAFQEMLAMGWVDNVPTRMVAVQTKGCNPVVRAFEAGEAHCELYEYPEETMANGLRVPKVFGDRLIMRTIIESNGFALDVTEEEMMAGILEFGRREGMFLSPEGAAVFVGFKKLINTGYIKSSDTVVLINTGSPYKYVDNMK